MSPELQISIIGAMSALVGSLVGGFVTIMSVHYAAKKQFDHELRLRELDKREMLYADFVAEVSNVLLRSLDNVSDDATEFTALFSLSSRMQFAAPKHIADVAKSLGRIVMDASKIRAEADQQRNQEDYKTMLRRFTEECRCDLDAQKRAYKSCSS